MSFLPSPTLDLGCETKPHFSCLIPLDPPTACRQATTTAFSFLNPSVLSPCQFFTCPFSTSLPAPLLHSPSAHGHAHPPPDPTLAFCPLPISHPFMTLPSLGLRAKPLPSYRHYRKHVHVPGSVPPHAGTTSSNRTDSSQPSWSLDSSGETHSE